MLIFTEQRLNTSQCDSNQTNYAQHLQKKIQFWSVPIFYSPKGTCVSVMVVIKVVRHTSLVTLAHE